MFDKNINITGKHATYAKELCPSIEYEVGTRIGTKNKGLFERIIDVYMIATVLGLHYGLKKPQDSGNKDNTTIRAEMIIKEKHNLEYIYHLVMLVDDKNLSPDKKIERAFKQNGDDNMELFHQYMRGGVEYLYEHLLQDSVTIEEQYNKVFELVQSFATTEI